MKRLSKTVALLLAALMTASLLFVPTFAEEAQEDPYAKLKEGVGYVAIGDSFTRGYGAGENWQNEIYRNDDYGDFDCRNVAASYPNLVADHFGLNAPDDLRDTSAKLWPLAHDAVSVAYMLDLLGIDDGYRDDEFTYQDNAMLRRYAADLQYFGDPESYTIDGQAKYGQTGEIMSVRDLLKNASLITIGLGQTDVIYKAQILGFNKLDMSDVAGLPAGIANIIKMLWNYFDYWKGAYPLLLDFIKEHNPGARVVIVGTLNPIKNSPINDDSVVPLGAAINLITDSMNAYMKQLALRYGYTYVDISDVETPTMVTPMSVSHILAIEDPIEFGLIAHPTTKGYAQIAARVIAAVEKNLGKDEATGLQKLTRFFASILDWFRALFAKFSSFVSNIGK